MKKFFYINYLSWALIIAFILIGCNPPSIEEPQPHDTIPPAEIEHTSVVDTSVVLDSAALLANLINTYLDGDDWRKVAMRAFMIDSLFVSVDKETKARLEFNYKIRSALDNKHITKKKSVESVQSLLENAKAKDYLGDEKFNTLKAGFELTPRDGNKTGTILGNLLGTGIPNKTFKEIKEIVDKAPRVVQRKTGSGTTNGSNQMPSSTAKNSGQSKCTCTKNGIQFGEDTTLFEALKNPSTVVIGSGCPKHSRFRSAVNEIQRYYEHNRPDYYAIYKDVLHHHHSVRYDHHEGLSIYIYHLLEIIKESEL